MINNSRKTRYQARVINYMRERHANKYQLMVSFSTSSESFVALRDKIISHYFGQRQAGVVCCVEALVLLVDRVLETMEHDAQAAQAA